MYNTAEWLGQWHGLRLSAASKTFAWVLFSTKKRVQHPAFWLFWFCVCGHWLLSPSPHGHLASARSGWFATVLTTRVQEPSTSETAALHRSTIKLDEKEVFFFLEVRHTGTLAIVVRPRPSKSVPSRFFFPKYLRQTPLDRHRLPTDTEAQVWRVLSDLYPIP